MPEHREGDSGQAREKSTGRKPELPASATWREHKRSAAESEAWFTRRHCSSSTAWFYCQEQTDRDLRNRTFLQTLTPSRSEFLPVANTLSLCLQTGSGMDHKDTH